jgi:putative membrane protein
VIRTLLFAAAVLAAAPVLADDKRSSDTKAFNEAEFVKKAASGGMHEVELSKLAAKQGKSAAVKKYGQMLVDDHTKANAELKKAATAAGMTVPDKMTDEDQKELDKFKSLSGEEFDRAFAKHAVEDHEKDIKEFTRASQEAKTVQVKDFAAKTLPTLQSHLNEAKKLAGK